MTGFNAYFGGTFDPPHLGHHEILLSLLRDPWTEKVFLIPTSLNPLKDHSSPLAFLGKTSQRLEWVKLWLEEVKAVCPYHLYQKLSLELLEIEGPELASYTIDTLQKLQAREKSRGNAQPWVLAVGGDVVKDLHRWKEVKILFETLSSIWIFPRGRQTNPVKEIQPELCEWCQFRMMGERVPDISSTKIREVLAAGRNASQNFSQLPLLATIKENLARLVLS